MGAELIIGFLSLMFSLVGRQLDRNDEISEQKANETAAINKYILDWQHTKQLNEQNLAFQRENRDYYNEINQAKRLTAAGYNPNLIHVGAVSQPAFQAQSAPPAPSVTSNLSHTLHQEMANSLKSSFYDAMIKKEQYLSMKENRVLRRDIYNLNWQKFVNDPRFKDSFLKQLIESETYKYYTEDDGHGNVRLNAAGEALASQYAKDFLDRLKTSGYQNTNIDIRNSNLEQYGQNLGKQYELLEQKLKSGRLNESESVQVLRLILEIIGKLK